MDYTKVLGFRPEIMVPISIMKRFIEIVDFRIPKDKTIDPYMAWLLGYRKGNALIANEIFVSDQDLDH